MAGRCAASPLVGASLIPTCWPPGVLTMPLPGFVVAAPAGVLGPPAAAVSPPHATHKSRPARPRHEAARDRCDVMAASFIARTPAVALAPPALAAPKRCPGACAGTYPPCS